MLTILFFLTVIFIKVIYIINDLYKFKQKYLILSNLKFNEI